MNFNKVISPLRVIDFIRDKPQIGLKLIRYLSYLEPRVNCKTMKISLLIEELNKWTPFNNAEDYDNIGLLCGQSSSDVSGVLVALDSTEEVVEEAIEHNCNTIIAFHPIIFKGLKQLNGETYVERAVLKAIKNNINIIALHTALDNVTHGVSGRMLQELNAEPLHILDAKSESHGLGMVGQLKNSYSEEQFLTLLKERFHLHTLRHSNFLSKPIERIAVLGGSGAYAIALAKKHKVDAYISADFKYHDFFAADNELLLIDIGHFESEQFTKNLIVEFLTEKFTNFVVILSQTKTNPVNYF